jgi:fused signal recognition particle receptor
LHTKQSLMEELVKVKRVIGKALPGAPHETLLVLDATVGQNGLAQARAFHAALGLTGIVVTKLDGTPKGGIVLAVVEELGVPVKWLGLGESAEALVPFDAEAFADGLVGASE